MRNPLFTFYFSKKNAQPNVDIGGIVEHHCLIKKKIMGSFDLKPQSIDHVMDRYIYQCTSIPKLGTEEIVPPVAM